MNLHDVTDVLFTNRSVEVMESDLLEMAPNGQDRIDLMASVFGASREVFDQYDERGISAGLRYLLNASVGSMAPVLFERSVPLDSRTRCVASMLSLFENLFARHCNKVIPFSSRQDVQANSFDWMCYMWWDIFPRHGIPRIFELDLLDDVILDTVDRILDIENFACKESAIHGFGHWQISYPNRVANALRDRFRIPAGLHEYAELALLGRVQ